jgi:hypothetical protein
MLTSMPDLADQVLNFIRDQRSIQQRFFGAGAPDRVLSFIASAATPGLSASLSVHPLRALARGSRPSELRLSLAGTPPRIPGAGETAAACLFNQYLGFQLKSDVVAPGRGVTCDGETTTVTGAHVYTLHHSPFMMNAFERVPVEEVLGAVGSVPYALLGVGTQVNLSPRFDWHAEKRDGRLVTFHGDGLPLKTWLNLKSNRLVTRALIDAASFEGYLLTGLVEEYLPEQEPVAWEATCRGFAAGGWGRPARCFRFVTDLIEPLAPLREPGRRG